MARPSDALLSWLRKLIESKRSSVADLAAKTQIPRPHLRKLLQGAEPMMVDELLLVSQALEIAPTDFGLPAGTPLDDGPPPDPTPPVADHPLRVDPWANHPEQLFRVGFGLACDFQFTSETRLLADSGVPAAVLSSNPRELGIRLDAAYHGYNEPKYTAEGITLTLSFDALYTCRFPWASIRQVVFWPAPPDAPATEPKVEPAKPKGGHLRLVT